MNASGNDLVANSGTLAEQKDARMKFLIDKVVHSSQLSGVEEMDTTPGQTRAWVAWQVELPGECKLWSVHS